MDYEEPEYVGYLHVRKPGMLTVQAHRKLTCRLACSAIGFGLTEQASARPRLAARLTSCAHANTCISYYIVMRMFAAEMRLVMKCAWPGVLA